MCILCVDMQWHGIAIIRMTILGNDNYQLVAGLYLVRYLFIDSSFRCTSMFDRGIKVFEGIKGDYAVLLISGAVDNT